MKLRKYYELRAKSLLTLECDSLDALVSTDLIDTAEPQKINWTNTIVFGLFHGGAIAALFHVQLACCCGRCFSLLDGRWPWHQHGISSAAHAPVISSAFGSGVFLCCLCDVDASRGTDLLGCHASNPSPEIRSARRSAFTPRGRLVGSRRLASRRREQA